MGAKRLALHEPTMQRGPEARVMSGRRLENRQAAGLSFAAWLGFGMLLGGHIRRDRPATAR